MVSAAGQPSQFASMWIPISSNRWSASTYVGGQSPFQPQTWCSYLKSVRGFWQSHGWLEDTYPYLWAMDEPGPARFHVVQQQAKVTHSCFAGSNVIITGKPTVQNRFLWNGGSDDVDVWAVLASRYYGEYTAPSLSRHGISHARQELTLINSAPAPSQADLDVHLRLALTLDAGIRRDRAGLRPAHARRLGGARGHHRPALRAGHDDLREGRPARRERPGEGLLRPRLSGQDGPISSARLEVLREGIEDWEIPNVVRHKHGDAAVRKLLSGLFSTTSKGARPGCTVGCPVTTSTPYSWAVWSHNAGRPRTVESMRAAALRAASSSG
jgi:hypothetical protein